MLHPVVRLTFHLCLFSLRLNRPLKFCVGIVKYSIESHTQIYRRIANTESYKLAGLYPDTLYYVWLAARSQRGEGATTPPIPVRTKQYGKLSNYMFTLLTKRESILVFFFVSAKVLSVRFFFWKPQIMAHILQLIFDMIKKFCFWKKSYFSNVWKLRSTHSISNSIRYFLWTNFCGNVFDIENLMERFYVIYYFHVE